jgi:uroporphyrin-III C-methyltransferase/precorrin-2 dehydrogenase/sirohydrochlorin ferrochelatase
VRQLAEEGTIEWRARPFEDADADEAWLAFAATPDPRVQQQVAAAMSARRRFCVTVDDPAHATAYSGGLVRRPPFTIAISSSGAAPALTRLLRELIEHILPGPDWVEHARRLRARWLAEGTPMADRFAELVRDVKKGP